MSFHILDNDGMTPLHRAVMGGRWHAIKAVLNHYKRCTQAEKWINLKNTTELQESALEMAKRRSPKTIFPSLAKELGNNATPCAAACDEGGKCRSATAEADQQVVDMEEGNGDAIKQIAPKPKEPPLKKEGTAWMFPIYAQLMSIFALYLNFIHWFNSPHNYTALEILFYILGPVATITHFYLCYFANSGTVKRALESENKCALAENRSCKLPTIAETEEQKAISTYTDILAKQIAENQEEFYKCLATPDAKFRRKNQLQPFRYCHECHVLKDLRTKHCRFCGECITEFDHHCVWLNKCVGGGNHRAFMVFSISQTLAVIITAVHAVANIVGEYDLYTKIPGNEDDFGGFFWEELMTFVGLVLSTLIGMWLWHLVAYHVNLVSFEIVFGNSFRRFQTIHNSKFFERGKLF